MSVSARRVAGAAGDQAWLLTAALCAVVAAAGARGPGFPAQELRVWLFRVHATLLFDNQWFSAHPLPGYSLLFPPLAALVGPLALGTICCVTSTWLLGLILHRCLPGQAGARRLALGSFAVVVVADLAVGWLPWTLGLTLALAAGYALLRERPVLAAAAALLAPFASPLAGIFLLLLAIAWIPRRRPALVAPLAATLPGLAASAYFGGDNQGLDTATFAVLLAAVGVGLWFVPRVQRTLRRFLLAYGVAVVADFAVPNPVGGDLARILVLFAGPVAAAVFWPQPRRRWLAALVVPLLAWQLAPGLATVADSVRDPAAAPGYYTGLLDFLQGNDRGRAPVEIPLTRGRWESSYVATQFPLAGGWQPAQTVAAGAASAGLAAAAYHQWLEANGVAFVALPDTRPDGASSAELQVLASAHPWLVPVWSDGNWEVWEVRDAAPLVSGDARLVSLTDSSFTVLFDRPGVALVRLHYTSLWSVTNGTGCLTRTPGGWTEVFSPAAGQVQVSVQLSLPSSLSAPSCLPAPG